MRKGNQDPLTTRSPRLVRAFTRYLRWYFARNFHAVRVSRSGVPEVPKDRPLIVYSNHPSWWDPALFFVLSAALFPGRASFGPMEEAALGKYALFRRLGVFGLEPGTRGAVRFLRTSTRILADRGNMLWITAEGVFSDVRQRPVKLRPGIAHLARNMPGVVILPLAVEYPFWNERKPETLTRFGRALTGDAGRDVAAWTALLEAELTACMETLADEAGRRDAALFLTVQHGSAGIGGVYDLWRRARAWSAGQRFDASHQGERG